MKDEAIWTFEPWQITAQKLLLGAHLTLINGEFGDRQDLASELAAIAEIISGLPVSLADHNSDGGCFPEELA